MQPRWLDAKPDMHSTHLDVLEAGAIIDLQEGKSASTRLAAGLHPAANANGLAHLPGRADQTTSCSAGMATTVQYPSFSRLKPANWRLK